MEDEIRGIAEHLEQRGPNKPHKGPQGRLIAPSSGRVEGGGADGMVIRSDFVPKEDERQYLARHTDGRLTFRLVDAGDRLVFWSPLDGGRVLNPKGPGLRAVGLVTTFARGSAYHGPAYRTADLRKSRRVELPREPNNPHDPNAIALHAPGARRPFGYVQRGRAASLAKRMDGGEHLSAISLRGPGPGSDQVIAFLVIGSVSDLEVLIGD